MDRSELARDRNDELAARLEVDVHFRPSSDNALADDVREGLTKKQKSIPPKYFYDERGSRLFDQICDTPEYYPTRTEEALLEDTADQILRAVRPTDIVELGSGAARKTRCLLDAAARNGLRVRYVPFDVSEAMLVESSRELLRDYPWLRIHGVVGDYEQHLDRIPAGPRRLFMFIGSTIGNFEHEQAVEFLRGISRQMKAEDRLLLGTDLVKDQAVLDAAYNDAQGVTEAFNKNLLTVINRELDADFRLDRFEHVAYFRRESSRVEMHLRSAADQQVNVGELDMVVSFDEGETIRTEISRKFTRKSLDETLEAAGLEIVTWYAPPNEYFALSLSRARNAVYSRP